MSRGIGVKECPQCNTEKPLNEFNIRPNGQPTSYCRLCTVKASSESQKKNRKSLNKYHNDYYHENKEKINARRRKKWAATRKEKKEK